MKIQNCSTSKTIGIQFKKTYEKLHFNSLAKGTPYKYRPSPYCGSWLALECFPAHFYNRQSLVNESKIKANESRMEANESRMKAKESRMKAILKRNESK